LYPDEKPGILYGGVNIQVKIPVFNPIAGKPGLLDYIYSLFT
jgi:hypothetical protein